MSDSQEQVSRSIKEVEQQERTHYIRELNTGVKAFQEELARLDLSPEEELTFRQQRFDATLKQFNDIFYPMLDEEDRDIAVVMQLHEDVLNGLRDGMLPPQPASSSPTPKPVSAPLSASASPLRRHGFFLLSMTQQEMDRFILNRARGLPSGLSREADEECFEYCAKHSELTRESYSSKP